MGIFTKKVILYFFIFFIFSFQKIKSENLDFAKKEFLLGNYESAIDISSKLNDLDSKIFQARAMSVYAHFFLKDEVAKNKFLEAYEIVKKISLKENGKVSDKALKLIVKISEGSVRDALSLLDRGILSTLQDEELSFEKAQKIFGFFDKAQIIDLFIFLLEGNESKTLKLYRKMFDHGMDPKVFINDFLELLYYLKNID